MKSLAQMLTRGLALLTVLLVSISLVAGQGSARVRFAHAIPGGTAIDVFINGSLAITALEFGSATTYLTVPAGDHTVTVTPAGIATPLWAQAITVEADRAITYIASSPATLRFDAFTDNLTETPFGTGRLLLVHALAGGPAVDIQLAEPVTLGGTVQPAGTVIAPQVAYGASFGSFDLPALTYVFNVVAGNTPLLSELAIPLTSNTSAIAVVYGTADAPTALLLTAPTGPAAGSGFVRLVHGVMGAPAVDVFINDTLIAPALSTDRPTEHIALPAGEHSVVLRAAGTADDLLEAALTVAAGGAQTVVALQGDTG
nr:DUF4397 domain-containing protein [Anaerolineae bacterium]